MREIKIGGETLSVRGLTRGELKALRADGINILNLTLDTSEDAMDRVFKIVLTEQADAGLDDRPYHESLDVWRAILVETFGSEDEEKN